MPFPVDYGTGVVTGTFTDTSGGPVAGTISFTPSASRLLGTGAVILGDPVIVELDEEGSISVTLPASDDPNVNPTDFTYRVDETFVGVVGSTYFIDVLEGTTLDLSDVAVPGVVNNGTVIWADGLPSQAGNAGEYLTTDGTDPVWTDLPSTVATLLNPLTASGAPTNAGPGSLLGFGSDPTPYEGGPLAAETIPANGWEGLKVAGQMRSTVGGSFPSAGFEFSVDLYVARRTYKATAGWIEAMTVHSYTLGGSNELHDWLEIAGVHDDPDLDTLRVGVDLRLNGEATEYTYISTARPLRFNTWHHLHVAQDPATAEITVTVDGDEIETGVPARIGDPMDTPTTPCTLSTPDAGADILLARGAVILGKVTLNEYGDPPATLCDPADGTDGALSFTSGARPWVTWGGRVAAPFTSRRLMAGPWSNPSASFDVGAADSFTWVITDVLLGYDFEFFDGVTLWGRNSMALGTTGVGWGFVILPIYGIPFAFGVTSSGAGGAALAQAVAVPQGRCTIAAVLDRDADELRLYAVTAAGLELLATDSASGVGAVAPSQDTEAQVVPEMGGHYLTYRRALTEEEITYLALEGNGAGSEVATTDASELISGTLPFARLPIGTTSTTVPAGNDARFSDARTPTGHKTSHATGGSDALAPSDIGAVPTSRQIAGLDLTSDRDAAALRAALALGTAYPLDSDTDAALTAASDSKVATQKATKSYVDARFPIHRSATTTRRISTKGSFNTGAAEGMTTTGDRVYAPIFLPAGTYNTLSVRSTTAGASTWRLGIFNGASGDPTRPGTVLKDAGTIDLSVTAAMLTLSSLNFTIPADGWYWCCAQVETYTSAPQLVCAFADSKTDLLFPGWPGQEGNYLRTYCGYQDLSPSAGALTTANAITGNASTGLDYAGNVPRFWVGP